jgi:hypothetical protein
MRHHDEAQLLARLFLPGGRDYRQKRQKSQCKVSEDADHRALLNCLPAGHILLD